MDNIWITVLSSAGIASIISTIVGCVFNVLMQKRKYKDDYYKMVINRRMNTYEKVENVLNSLRTWTPKNSTQTTFCVIFENEEILVDFHKQLYDVMVDSVWLSEGINDNFEALNELIIKTEQGIMECGFDVNQMGTHLNDLMVDIHNHLETHYINDMLKLYDVKDFLESKNK